METKDEMSVQAIKLETILESDNIAEKLDEESLRIIGSKAVEGFLSDLASRERWEKDLEKWTELALQISKEKTYPWQNASNVKYPLLATAAMQFAARAYPSLVPSNGQLVKCKVGGYDPDGEKHKKADRIQKYMSYQLMYEMEDWEEEMDKLLLALPIVGTIFKKTYFDAALQRNRSCVVFPRDLVVNYWAKTLEDAERKTEIIPLSSRKVEERMRKGFYLEVDLPSPSAFSFDEDKVKQSTQEVSEDDTTTPYKILEQHTYIDLDGDGYEEPYIVVVEFQSNSVLRIQKNYDEKTISVEAESNKVVSIEPIEYYTKFGFVPNPDGGFYDIGFGRLLGTINASVDTIINQLIDSGSLANLQAGFIGKGLRIKMGESRFQPGEWKAVNATGDDLKKQIVPLPANPPSPVLLQLLQYLVQSGKELASVAEIMVGKMPGQNTPATTTMASIEQGMKVFTAVYKRVFRSMSKEFKKLHKLNAQFLNAETYVNFLDTTVQQQDFLDGDMDIIPAADPAAVSSQEKQQKAQLLMQMMGLGTLDPMKVTAYVLEAHEIPQPEQFMRQPQQQPDPKMEEMKIKAQLEQQKAQAKMQVDAIKMKMQVAQGQQKMELEKQAKEMDLKYRMIEHALEVQKAQAQGQQALQQQSDNHKMGMATQAQAHMMKMKQQAEAAQSKPKTGKES